MLPDPTAVFTAVWRAQHLRLDPPPHVLEDEIGLQLADHAETLAGMGFAPPDGANGALHWTEFPPFSGPLADWLRPEMLGRARFVEDLLISLIETEGLDQYVILGAGLDSFALRRPDLASTLRVYEIDQPGPQGWKEQRLAQLGFEIPKGLHFVPVDFEAGEDWMPRLAAAGFDGGRPALFCSLGLSQYLTREATATIFAQVAALAPGTTIASTFAVPDHLVDPDELEAIAVTKDICEARGCPWVAEYTPAAFEALARDAGFTDVHYQSTTATTERYFAGRPDRLKVPSVEHLLVARTARGAG